jgi:hypothetical protein
MEVNIILFMEPAPLGSRTNVRGVFPTTTVSRPSLNRLMSGVREKYAVGAKMFAPVATACHFWSSVLGEHSFGLFRVGKSARPFPANRTFAIRNGVLGWYA